tara:strand:- start:21732 stop:22277 length:546 start_codon:yes stop_codon:yes gene_type:complete
MIKQKANKKCNVCKKIFRPFNSMQKVCGTKCALTIAQEKTRKDEKSNLQERRRRLKTSSDLKREAQVPFNKYIRLRDQSEPCISCQRHHAGQYHAGHYISVGASGSLRYNELNCHKQCAPCNNHLSGNIVHYRVNLIKKIGLEQVEALENDHEIKKYSRDELIDIKELYSKKARKIEKELN